MGSCELHVQREYTADDEEADWVVVDGDRLHLVDVCGDAGIVWWEAGLGAHHVEQHDNSDVLGGMVEVGEMRELAKRLQDAQVAKAEQQTYKCMDCLQLIREDELEGHAERCHPPKTNTTLQSSKSI